MNISIINTLQFFVIKRSRTFSAASISTDATKASVKAMVVFF